MAIISPDGLPPVFRFNTVGTTFVIRGRSFYVRRRCGQIRRNTPKQLQRQSQMRTTQRHFNTLPDFPFPDFGWYAAVRDWLGRAFPSDRFGDRIGGTGCIMPQVVAGDPLATAVPPVAHLTGVSFTSATWINKDTIQIAFNPSPAGANFRIKLKQTLPRPGRRKPQERSASICQITGVNPTSPVNFTTHFQHLSGWHARYFAFTQHTDGRFAEPQIFDI